jgi:hypothetical protein
MGSFLPPRSVLDRVVDEVPMGQKSTRPLNPGSLQEVTIPRHQSFDIDLLDVIEYEFCN